MSVSTRTAQLHWTICETAEDPIVVVVGSEGRGLSRLVGETCDLTVSIPMASAGRVAQRVGGRGGHAGRDRASPPGMTSLLLDKQGLRELPALPPDLVELSAWGNALSEVPEAIAGLHGLRVLVLAGNRLRAVPASLAGLTQLRTLDLGHNEIDMLPARLPDAKYLYLHDNRLRALPPALCQLARLRYLNVSDNPLGELPSCIGELSALIELRAERCRAHGTAGVDPAAREPA